MAIQAIHTQIFNRFPDKSTDNSLMIANTTSLELVGNIGLLCSNRVCRRLLQSTRWSGCTTCSGPTGYVYVSPKHGYDVTLMLPQEYARCHLILLYCDVMHDAWWHVGPLVHMLSLLVDGLVLLKMAHPIEAKRRQMIKFPAALESCTCMC